MDENKISNAELELLKDIASLANFNINQRELDYQYYVENKIFTPRILVKMKDFIDNPRYLEKDIYSQHILDDVYFWLQNLDICWKLFYTHIQPSKLLAHNWHLSYLGDYFTSIIEGRIEKLLINMPPGHSKTTFLTTYNIMLETFHPGIRNMIKSGTQEVRATLSGDIKEILQWQFYQEIFPEIQIDEKKTETKTEYHIKKFVGAEGIVEGNGFFRVSSDSAQVTGADADAITWDDPIDAEVYKSEGPNYLNKVNGKFATLDGRDRSLKNLKEGGFSTKFPFVICHQRIAEGDITDFVKQSPNYKDWQHIVLPVKLLSDMYRGNDAPIKIYDKKEQKEKLVKIYKSPKHSYLYEVDKFLFPEKFDDRALQAKRYNFGTKGIDFEMQYYQTILTTSDKLFNIQSIMEYDPDEFEKKNFDLKIITVDPAEGENIGNDYLAAALLYVKITKTPEYNILDFYLRKICLTQGSVGNFVNTLKNWIVDFSFNPQKDKILVERRSTGHQIIKEMEMAVLGHDLKPDDKTKNNVVVGIVQNSMDKLDRAASVAFIINELHLHFPSRECPWYADTEVLKGKITPLIHEAYEELKCFPSGTMHDDFVDIITQALMWARNEYNNKINRMNNLNMITKLC